MGLTLSSPSAAFFFEKKLTSPSPSFHFGSLSPSVLFEGFLWYFFCVQTLSEGYLSLFLLFLKAFCGTFFMFKLCQKAISLSFSALFEGFLWYFFCVQTLLEGYLSLFLLFLKAFCGTFFVFKLCQKAISLFFCSF